MKSFIMLTLALYEVGVSAELRLILAISGGGLADQEHQRPAFSPDFLILPLHHMISPHPAPSLYPTCCPGWHVKWSYRYRWCSYDSFYHKHFNTIAWNLTNSLRFTQACVTSKHNIHWTLVWPLIFHIYLPLGTREQRSCSVLPCYFSFQHPSAQNLEYWVRNSFQKTKENDNIGIFH